MATEKTFKSFSPEERWKAQRRAAWDRYASTALGAGDRVPDASEYIRTRARLAARAADALLEERDQRFGKEGS